MSDIITLPGKIHLIEITYSELRKLRDSGDLIPGTLYRIIDYKSTTTQTNTTIAEHDFDIIVKADSESILNENASAIEHVDIVQVSYSDETYLYKRYSDGDNTNGAAWAFIDSSDSHIGINEIISNDLDIYDIDTSDIIYTINKVPSIGEVVNMGDIKVPIVDIGEPYFHNSDLASWELKYCLDNDTDRFAWAEDSTRQEGEYIVVGNYDTIPVHIKCDRSLVSPNPSYHRWYRLTTLNGVTTTEYFYTEVGHNAVGDTVYVPGQREGSIVASSYVVKQHNPGTTVYNGKGVIYYMKDEFGNEAPYDFKNIMFKRSLSNGVLDVDSGDDTWVYTFNAFNLDDETIEDASVISGKESFDDSVNKCFKNIIKEYKTTGHIQNDAAIKLNNSVFLNTYSPNAPHYFYCEYNTFGNDCYNNTLGNDCYNNTFGNDCNNNTLGNDCNNINLENSCYNNTFGSYINNITVFYQVHKCNVVGGTVSGAVRNAQILSGVCGTSSQNLQIDFEANKTYTQIAALRDDPTGQLTPAQRLVIWDSTVQPDWEQTSTTAKDYIKNKPTYLSGIITEKTYGPYTCSAADVNNGYIYFMHIIPTSSNYFEPWHIRYTLEITTDRPECQGFYDITVGSAGTTQQYCIFNKFYSTSYYPSYYHLMAWHNSSAKYANRETYPIRLGERIYSAYQATSRARTYTIKVYDLRGCELIFPDSIETYGSFYSDAHYGYNTTYNATSNGVLDNYDANTVPYQYYEYYTNYLIHDATTPLYRYKLIGFDEYNKIVPLTVSNRTSNTQTTLIPCSVPVIVSKGINWYYSSTDVTVPTTRTATALIYRSHAATNTHMYYNFNGLPPQNCFIYLKGFYNFITDQFTLDNTDLKSWYVCIPDTVTKERISEYLEEGFYYWQLGTVGSSTTDYGALYLDNPLYYYDGETLTPVENLSNRNISSKWNNQIFTKRSTNGKNSTRATIHRLRGLSLAWNQLAISCDVTGGSISTSEGIVTVTPNNDSCRYYIKTVSSGSSTTPISTHIYLQSAVIKSNYPVKFINYSGGMVGNTPTFNFSSGDDFRLCYDCFRATSNSTTIIQMYSPSGNVFYVKEGSFMLFDLTMMFGKDLEPTPEEFFRLFPREAYDYCEGTIINSPSVVNVSSYDLDNNLIDSSESIGDSNIILRSSGLDHDEISGTTKITRVGTVNLGDLTWVLQYSSLKIFKCSGFSNTYGSDKVKGSSSTNPYPSLLCGGGYSQRLTDNTVANLLNKEMFLGSSSGDLYIRDTRYSTTADFKTAVNNVYITFSLATPLESTVTDLGTVSYKCNLDGYEVVTEAYQGVNNATPTCAPFRGDIIYNSYAQSDWEETSSESFSYIQNKPAIKAGTGTNSIIEGDLTNNKAYGYYSHSEGILTIAYDDRSHAEGYGFNPTSGSSVVAFKVTGTANNTAYTINVDFNNSFLYRVIYYNGVYAKINNGMSYNGVNFITLDKTLDSENNLNDVDVLWVPAASNWHAHTEGVSTAAAGNGSHAEGRYTIAVNNYEHAQGQFNVSNKINNSFGNPGNTLASIGIGLEEVNRENAIEVMQNGDIYFNGVNRYDGTNALAQESGTVQSAINESLSNVTTQQDGSIVFVKNSGDTITVDLTHTHPGMITTDGTLFVMSDYDSGGGGSNNFVVEQQLPNSWQGNMNFLDINAHLTVQNMDESGANVECWIEFGHYEIDPNDDLNKFAVDSHICSSEIYLSPAPKAGGSILSLGNVAMNGGAFVASSTHIRTSFRSTSNIILKGTTPLNSKTKASQILARVYKYSSQSVN